MNREDLKRAWKYLRGDGCTAVPDLTYSKCCRAHDADYRYAVNEEGEELTREEADKRLRECMMKTGKTLTPMEQFVQVLRDALLGLGVFTAAMSDPKK